MTAAGYHFEENRYASGEGETVHRTDFTVIPASVSYRPAQSTAWPRTYGPQTAKVVGPNGEYLDRQIRSREGEVPLGPSGEGG